MALKIYKKGQGSIARLLAGGIAAVVCYRLGNEAFELLSKYMGVSEGIGIGMGVIVCVASVLLCGNYLLRKPKSVDYLIETELEMRKVNWPTRKEVIASTGVVIAVVVVLATYIFLNDLVIGWLLRVFKVYGS